GRARGGVGEHRGFYLRDTKLARDRYDGKPHARWRRQCRVFAGGIEGMILCRHFGVCGGCALQDMPPDAYRRYKQELVEKALARIGFTDAVVDEPVLSPE